MHYIYRLDCSARHVDSRDVSGIGNVIAKITSDLKILC